MRLPSPAKLIARTVHSVVSEYQKLDAKPEAWRQEMSCTSANTQVHTDDVRYGWGSGSIKRPQSFGFGKEGNG